MIEQPPQPNNEPEKFDLNAIRAARQNGEVEADTTNLQDVIDENGLSYHDVHMVRPRSEEEQRQESATTEAMIAALKKRRESAHAEPSDHETEDQ